MPTNHPNSSVLLLNGPNLNLLGTREPEVYGKTTLEDITRRMGELAKNTGISLESFQSNHEGELIDRVQKAKKDGIGFIIINPGGFTHTSVALRDALAVWRSHLLRCTFQIFTSVKNFANILISQT